MHENSEDYIGRIRKKLGPDLLKLPGGRIVMENSDGHILLHRRADFKIWGLPAGAAEDGESIRETITREVVEETGLHLLHLECFGVSTDPAYEVITYPNGDRVHCYSTLFYSNQWEGTLVESNDETLECQFFSPHQLPEMMRHHQRTVARFLTYKTTGQIQCD
jgi:ADP-ribose pyrophosphatase YjhB (NUDIX family)